MDWRDEDGRGLAAKTKKKRRKERKKTGGFRKHGLSYGGKHVLHPALLAPHFRRLALALNVIGINAGGAGEALFVPCKLVENESTTRIVTLDL